MARIVQQTAAAAGARAVLPGLPAGVEAVRRGDYLFVLNQTGRPVEFAAPAGSIALAGGERLGTDDVAVLGLKSAP